MTKTSRIKTLLEERKSLKKALDDAEETIIGLDAYLKTMLKTVVKDNLTLSCPSHNELEFLETAILIENDYPFYITNLGKLPEINPKNATGGAIYPVFYKTVRKFTKNCYTKSQNNQCWYTTSILKNNDTFYFVITDDENNTWKGIDPFADFIKCLTGSIPFNSIEEWIGLNISSVRYLIGENERKRFEKAIQRKV